MHDNDGGSALACVGVVGRRSEFANLPARHILNRGEGVPVRGFWFSSSSLPEGSGCVAAHHQTRDQGMPTAVCGASEQRGAGRAPGPSGYTHQLEHARNPLSRDP